MSFSGILHRNAKIHSTDRPAPPYKTGTADVSPQDRRDSFFTSPLIANQLAVLNEMAGKRRSILVTGEHGIGKTTFIHRFMSGGPLAWQKAAVRFTASRRSSAHKGYQTVRRQIFVSKTGALPSVLIDDAHQLDMTELRALIHAVCPIKGHAVLGSVILVADASIRKHTDTMLRWMPAVAAMEIIHLAPLTEAQTVRYLQHQLEHTGSRNTLPLTNAQAHRIFQNSGGIPKLIDSQLDQLLNGTAESNGGSAETLLKWLRKRGMRRTRQWNNRLQTVRN